VPEECEEVQLPNWNCLPDEFADHFVFRDWIVYKVICTKTKLLSEKAWYCSRIFSSMS
jgi:hypothetical protein